MYKKLTSSDIKSIVQSGEGYNAEFKIRVPKKVRELSEEICAFANSAGGILLIGVSDDNVILIKNFLKSSVMKPDYQKL